MLLSKEGPFEVDALNASSHKLGTARLVCLGDSGASRADVLGGLGERSGDPRSGATANKLGAGNINPLSVTIGRSVVIESVDMGVHEARGNPATTAINDLARRFLRLPRSKVTIDNGQVSVIHNPSGQNEMCIGKCIGAHLNAPIASVRRAKNRARLNKKRPPAARKDGRAPEIGTYRLGSLITCYRSFKPHTDTNEW